MFFTSTVVNSGHIANLIRALQHLADHHPELLQALSAHGNASKEITKLFNQLSINTNLEQVESAAQHAMAQQHAATPCPYCLETFLLVFGISVMLTGQNS